jgi:hypothetical protein
MYSCISSFIDQSTMYVMNRPNYWEADQEKHHLLADISD